jgi:hypothetical protein
MEIPTVMNPKVYQIAAHTTALDLGITGKTASSESANLVYPLLGLISEIGELIDTINMMEFNNLKSELGDIFWYCAEIYTQYGKEFEIKTPISFHQIDETILLDMFQSASVLCGKVKKGLRESAPITDKIFYSEMTSIVGNLAGICECLDYSCEEIMRKNLEKLFSRKERGCITGSGNCR